MLDLVIHGGTILDGTGARGFRADVGIEGDRIAVLGDLSGSETSQGEVDASGLYVTPGFIDIHTHSDLMPLVNPRMESKVRQGVAIEVVGNCGEGYAPLRNSAISTAEKQMSRFGQNVPWRTMGEYMAALETNGMACNVVALVGHGILRESVMGYDMRPPTPEELQEMRQLLSQSLEEGAAGFSSGLIYPPSCYADTNEFIELAKVAATRGAFYATHMRNQGEGLLESVADALRIGEESGAAVQISHLKATGRRAWGKVPQALEMMDRARERGVDVSFDRYPYLAASTGLSTTIPRWAHEGGVERLMERLRDPRVRGQIVLEISEPTAEWDSFGPNVGWDKIVIAQCASNPEYEGRSIAEVGSVQGKDSVDAAFDLLIANRGQVQCILYSMSEEDVSAALRHPGCLIASDGYAFAPYGALGEGKPHPRSYGTFPRLLAEYVRGQGLLTWEDAVAKMTSRPADRLGLPSRGRVQVGCFADLVVLNPETVSDTATFADPHQYPVGIDYVIVNGTVVVSGGEHTGALPGRVVRQGK